MMLRGRVWKEGKWWVIECPAIDASTQGKTKANALEMLADWVRTTIDDPEYEVAVASAGADEIYLLVSDPKPIVALMISQARAAAGMTLAEVGEATGKGGKNARSVISVYESGKHDPGFAKVQELLNAMGYDLEVSVRKRA